MFFHTNTARIPVIINEKGVLEGVDVVIDKDLAGKVLAEEVDADILLILTNVDSAKLDYGKPTERLVKEMTASQARTYIAEGQFPPGNMGPKVEACIKFVESVGEKAIITSLERAVEALKGRAGTLMTRG